MLLLGVYGAIKSLKNQKEEPNPSVSRNAVFDMMARIRRARFFPKERFDKVLTAAIALNMVKTATRQVHGVSYGLLLTPNGTERVAKVLS